MTTKCDQCGEQNPADTQTCAPVRLQCNHQWFSTGAMAPGECRCIQCGTWGKLISNTVQVTREQLAELYPPPNIEVCCGEPETCNSPCVHRGMWLAATPAAQPAPVQEPVYLVWLKAHCAWVHTDKAGFDKTSFEDRWLLYTPKSTHLQHLDDVAVDSFAAEMKSKMAKQRAKGYGGWDNKDECPTERLQTMLAEHLAKGDPVDVGNFAMMLWNRGESTTHGITEKGSAT